MISKEHFKGYNWIRLIGSIVAMIAAILFFYLSSYSEMPSIIRIITVIIGMMFALDALQGYISFLLMEQPGSGLPKMKNPPSPPEKAQPYTMTEEEFCRVHSEQDCDYIDKIGQLTLDSFTGEELKEYAEHHIRAYISRENQK